MKTRLVSIIFLLVSICPIYAEEINFSKEEVTEICNAAVNKINDFISYLPEIGAKADKSYQEKQLAKKYIGRTLKLFIGEGEEYDYVDSYDNIRKHPPVTMQVTTLRGVKKKPRPMKSYLNSLMGLPYHKVEFDTVETVRIVGKFKKVPGMDNMYKTEAYYVQIFRGYDREGRFKGDRTGRSVDIYIKRRFIPNAGENGEDLQVFDILLGDVKALTKFEYDKYVQ